MDVRREDYGLIVTLPLYLALGSFLSLGAAFVVCAFDVSISFVLVVALFLAGWAMSVAGFLFTKENLKRTHTERVCFYVGRVTCASAFICYLVISFYLLSYAFAFARFVDALLSQIG